MTSSAKRFGQRVPGAIFRGGDPPQRQHAGIPVGPRRDRRLGGARPVVRLDIEALTEHELQALARHYGKLARLAREEADLTKSHSVEEARSRHTAKRKNTIDS